MISGILSLNIILCLNLTVFSLLDSNDRYVCFVIASWSLWLWSLYFLSHLPLAIFTGLFQGDGFFLPSSPSAVHPFRVFLFQIFQFSVLNFPSVSFLIYFSAENFFIFILLKCIFLCFMEHGYIIVILGSLSNGPNICTIFYFLCWLFSPLITGQLPGSFYVNYFGIYPGYHEDYLCRLWILLKSFRECLHFYFVSQSTQPGPDHLLQVVLKSQFSASSLSFTFLIVWDLHFKSHFVL